MTSARIQYRSYEGIGRKHPAKTEEGVVVREGFLEEVTFRPVPEMKKCLFAKSQSQSVLRRETGDGKS